MNAETISEVGDAQQAICDAVQKLNITLLILGDRGIGKIKRLLPPFLFNCQIECISHLHETPSSGSDIHYITEISYDTGLF